MALLDDVSFDDVTYAVRAREWLGRDLLFSKLGRQTEEFTKALAANRALLTQESAATLTVNVPSLPAGARASLAAMWPVGRPLELDAMERACPGFDKTFSAAWLATLPRRQEAGFLKDWASAGSVRLGCSRFEGEPAGAETASEPAGQVAAADRSPAEPSTTADAAEPATPDMTGAADGASVEGALLWMLCSKGEHWFLESLSSGDRATYHFKGGRSFPDSSAPRSFLAKPCTSPWTPWSENGPSCPSRPSTSVFSWTCGRGSPVGSSTLHTRPGPPASAPLSATRMAADDERCSENKRTPECRTLAHRCAKP